MGIEQMIAHEEAIKERSLRMRDKDKDRLSEKIEEAINILSLEKYLDMPDYLIAQMLVDFMDAMVRAKNAKRRG